MPDILIIGHITQDLHAHGAPSLGGTASYAALTSQRLGLEPAIVTSAHTAILDGLITPLVGIPIALQPSPSTTTFINQYHQGGRTQFQRDRAADIQPAHVPLAWLDTPVVLLSPVAGEFGLDMIRLFPRGPGRIIAATPQGWMRTVDGNGKVHPAPWQEAETILPLLDAVILSEDDLAWYDAETHTSAGDILALWSGITPILIVTAGAQGATLFCHGIPTRHPAFAAVEQDPTGAGDVFAAALLTHLSRHSDPHAAVRFANGAASLSIEGVGASAIPTLRQVEQRLAHPSCLESAPRPTT